MKSKSLILMVVSLGFGLIAAIGISQVMGNNSKGEPTVERGQVLVAAMNLKHGDELTEENVKIEHWPKEVIPETAVRDFEQIKHKRITTRLSKALPIMMEDTATREEMDSVTIPKGMKLVSIKVSAEQTQAGLLKPGDHVDVIGVVEVRSTDGNSRKKQTVSETFLRNIEVYSVDGRTSSAGPREGKGGKSSIVGVLVNEKQSEMIVLVQKIAKLQLVMRGNQEVDEDVDEFTDYEDFAKSIFGEKGEADVEVVPAQPVAEFMHTTRVLSGPNVEEIQFKGDRRVQPQSAGQIPPPSPAFAPQPESDFNDSSDFVRPGENESDLEEDQYPGE